MDNADRGPHRRVPSFASVGITTHDQRNDQIMAYDESDTGNKRYSLVSPTLPTRISKRMTLHRCMILFAFICLSVLLAGPFIGFHPQSLFFSSGSQHRDDQVGITLHPHAHRSRQPKTLQFDWTVTTGLRRPDGVKKQVYLVNGQSEVCH